MTNEELKKLARKVLEDAYVMSLGTVDEKGVWVADVIYIMDDAFNLYWVSLPTARHSKAIAQNANVACTVTASWADEKERALQIAGRARKIEGALFEHEKKLDKKRGCPLSQKPGEILEDGHSWYVLEPTMIELIHSEPFGYERQSIKLS